MEVPVVLCSLLHSRSFRSSHIVHGLRDWHGSLHDVSVHLHQLPDEQHGCQYICCGFRLLVQLLHPNWLPRRQLPLLYRDRPNPAACCHVVHLYRQPLVMVSY